MADAYRDGNSVPTLIAASSADGTTIVRIQVDEPTHSLEVMDGTTGTDYGTANAKRDGNSVPVLLATSSADGFTPIEVYADAATGALLIQST